MRRLSRTGHGGGAPSLVAVVTVVAVTLCLLAAAMGPVPPRHAPSAATGRPAPGPPTVWLCRPGQAHDPCAYDPHDDRR